MTPLLSLVNKNIKIKDRNAGLGFDKEGQFVPLHMRGPDVTLFRGKCSLVSVNKGMILSRLGK